MSTRQNMYVKSVCQWNPCAGCGFACKYCVRSFQAMLKRWAKANCPSCYRFEPHEHPWRLKSKLPRTHGDEFIFTTATGDLSFCTPDYLERIFEVIRKYADRTFLIQTKNPGVFRSTVFPANVILGTTIETNSVKEYQGVSAAPLPEQRFNDILAIDHPRKMVTIEPVIDFDLDIMKSWIRAVRPVMVWIGYDSRKTGLIEPAKEKVMRFVDEMRADGFNVIPKLIREPIRGLKEEL